jgi:2'-5' RNA ligase
VRTRDHWAVTAPLWEHGEPVLAWHVLFGRDAPPAAIAGRLTRVLDLPFLDPVPPEWLHLTTQGVGRASRVPAGMRDRLVREVEARCAEIVPIPVTLGPARLVDEGVTADAAPTEPLAALRRLLQEADSAVRGGDQVPDLGTPFWPHVSFAYARADADSGTPAQDLEVLALETTAELTVDAVSLLLLRQTSHLYCWDVVARVPLAAGEPG